VLTVLEFCGSIFLLVFAFERATKAVDRVRRLQRQAALENEPEESLHLGVGDGLE
jgi:hypothetical protein|tara:strand:+ start:1473 stop:1637 length:165 start_codon:yes stop_codon:yes gene_type:complete